ncbi:MAG TPA: hypothetical protein VIW94_02975 [Acidimicrobiia bacterium]
MTLEQRLSEALHSADHYEPSPDLFSRVDRSVEEDKAHRRRLARNFTVSAVGLMAIAVATGSSIQVSPTGLLLIPAWVLESIATVVMALILVVLGPSIRRFGRDYVDDIFAITNETGERILQLLDIAYYLVFTGLIMTSIQLTNWKADVVFQSALEDSLVRIGRMMVTMGILHAVTLLVLPVVGFVYSSLVWTDYRNGLGRNPPPPLPGAAQAARVMKITLIVVGVVIALNLLGLIPVLIAGLIDP